MSLIFYLSLFLFVFGYKGADFVKLDTNFFQLSWIIPEQVLRVVYPVFEEAMLLARHQGVSTLMDCVEACLSSGLECTDFSYRPGNKLCITFSGQDVLRMVDFANVALYHREHFCEYTTTSTTTATRSIGANATSRASDQTTRSTS